MEDFRAKIATASTVTFDVFDTLIARTVLSPGDVFTLMEERVREISDGLIVDFRRFRVQAESRAREIARNDFGYQDVTLAEIYAEFKSMLDIPDEYIGKICDLEIETEHAVVIPRAIGADMLRVALRDGKDVMLISDMYLSASQIRDLLAAVGISGYEAIYVSSEIRKSKKEGDLFDYIIQRHGLVATDIVHVGDNAIGDFSVPAHKGIGVTRLRRAEEALFSEKRIGMALAPLKKSRTLSDSLLFSTVARGVFDTPGSEGLDSFSTGDPVRFGYAVFGPTIVGFASWIYREAVRDGVKDLYFLSRDGWIVKEVFSLLFAKYSDCPKVHYFHASRRATRVAQISGRASILKILALPIYSIEIGRYFETRFGLRLSDIPLEVLRAHGVSSHSHRIGAKFDREKLKNIALDLEVNILRVARAERQALCKAMEKARVISPYSAIVDIGYAGTMQSAFSSLGAKDIRGYYFATFDSVFSNLPPGKVAKGYICEGATPDQVRHGIGTHRFVYESVFCSREGTFIRYEEDESGDVIKVFGQHEDRAREKLVDLAYSGVLRLASDLSQHSKCLSSPLYIDSRPATMVFEKFITVPAHTDAMLFEGVKFEDSMGPDTIRYLVPPTEKILEKSMTDAAIWAEGTRALAGHVKRNQMPNSTRSERSVKTNHAPARLTDPQHTPVVKAAAWWQKGILAAEYYLASKFLAERKFKKYIRDREIFFVDSRKEVMRKYYRYFGRFAAA
ncbi:HAD family hydrolase [Cupriavidus nantongensis]|uniref:HAD family hydrolase n=1 Tax=Cupriavidus nantongensis TaxID=1796606 RepID=UPI000A508C8D|nr:hypothetical protein [Cupriavidus nantongensis]